MFGASIESYVKDCNICWALKLVKHKLYGKLQFFSVSTYQWKD